jgi:hypothetical protein
VTHEEKLTSPRSRAILALLSDYEYTAYIDPDPDTNLVIIVNVGKDNSITYSCLPRDYLQVRLFIEGKLDATPYTKT